MAAQIPSGDDLATTAATAFRRFRDGDPSAMPFLVESVTPLLWSVARQQGVTRPCAEDVVQNTWMQLIQHAGTIADPQSVLKWLITTTKRDAWNICARSQREEPAIAGDVAEHRTDETGPDAELLVLEEISNSVLWKHFTALSARCQLLLRAIAFSDRPDYAGVAEALGMPIGSIGPTRGRCLAKFRLALTNDPEWEMTS